MCASYIYFLILKIAHVIQDNLLHFRVFAAYDDKLVIQMLLIPNLAGANKLAYSFCMCTVNSVPILE